MAIKKKVLFILCFSIIFSIMFTGCEEKSNNNGAKNRIFIDEDNNDGIIAQEESNVEGIIISESNEPLKVGLFSSSEYSAMEQNFLARGIFRFDISDWDNTGITFNIKCVDINGNPNALEVYFMDDPGELPNYDQLQDVSPIWSLTESLVRFIGEFYPNQNEWIKVDLPKEIVERIIDEKYSKDQYLTIMVKLFLDFDLDEYDNYFEFASNDYSPADNSDRPYIEYTQ